MEMTYLRNLLLLSALFGLLGLAGCASTGGKSAAAGFPEKVVYHVNDSTVAGVAMNNVKNHLSANPQATIVMVTHGKGIDFLLEGATDKDGNPYDVKVQELRAKGVTFDVCNNTLVGRKIDPKKVIPEAVIVPSGVAEISMLQSQQNYVYLKP
jgi:intracellular sulfur oxidation DsrE/DsrF family protein